MNINKKKPIALCVDDSALNRKFVGKFLEKYFDMMYAVDGLGAVNVVSESIKTNVSIDIIFMDNVMPLMDGLEATQKIRGMGYHRPIIGVTGNCLSEQIDEFTSHGATMVLQKPLKIESFSKAICGKDSSYYFLLFLY